MTKLADLKTFDPADYIEDREAAATYLDEMFGSDDVDLIKRALLDIARSKSMSQISEEAGITRAGLYKALGPDGDPKLTTLLKVIKSLGVELSVQKKTT